MLPLKQINNVLEIHHINSGGINVNVQHSEDRLNTSLNCAFCATEIVKNHHTNDTNTANNNTLPACKAPSDRGSSEGRQILSSSAPRLGPGGPI